MGLTLVDITWAEAVWFVEAHHRHHGAPPGGKFWQGVVDRTGTLRGVAITGRPVSRVLDDGATLEITRVATDGTRNACSMLYAAARRAARARGYPNVITYTQAGESGASLRAAGFRLVYTRRPKVGWNTPARPRSDPGTAKVRRYRWEG